MRIRSITVLKERCRTFPSTTVATARKHWLLITFLSLGCALRLFAVLGYYPALLYIDSFRYLPHPSGAAVPNSDPIGYGLVLRPLLAVGNLTTVVVLQHLLVIGSAVAIYLLLRRYQVRPWLAAPAVAPVLLDAYQVQIEENIMSDTLFEALVVAGVLALAWNRRPSLRAVAIGGVVLGLAVPVRTVGEVLVIPAAAFVMLSGPNWRRRLGSAAAVVVAFGLPILTYSAFYSSNSGGIGPSHRAASDLYGRVATFVDCAKLKLPSDERELCPVQPIGSRPGVDWFVNSKDSPAQRLPAATGKARSALERAFAIEAIEHQPLDFVRAVGSDFGHGFALDRTKAPADTPESRWQFQLTYPTYPPLNPVAATKHEGQGAPTVNLWFARILRTYQLDGGYTPGPLLAVALALGIAGTLTLSRTKDRATNAVCLLITFAGAGLLLFADTFEYSPRYQLPGVLLLPAAGALGLTILINSRRRTHRPLGKDAEREGDSPPAGIVESLRGSASVGSGDREA